MSGKGFVEEEAELGESAMHSHHRRGTTFLRLCLFLDKKNIRGLELQFKIRKMASVNSYIMSS